jgi:hypothetical protein
MNQRDRVLAAFRHEEPDRVPIDFGGTMDSTMSALTYQNLSYEALTQDCLGHRGYAPGLGPDLPTDGCEGSGEHRERRTQTGTGCGGPDPAMGMTCGLELACGGGRNISGVRLRTEGWLVKSEIDRLRMTDLSRLAFRRLAHTALAHACPEGTEGAARRLQVLYNSPTVSKPASTFSSSPRSLLSWPFAEKRWLPGPGTAPSKRLWAKLSGTRIPLGGPESPRALPQSSARAQPSAGHQLVFFADPFALLRTSARDRYG